MSDDEDDLEIVETSIVMMNSNEPDIDDLRFQLRNEERRLKELFPHVKSIYELDFKELSAGKTIIDREHKEKQKSLSDSQRIIGQKRKEGPLTQQTSTTSITTQNSSNPPEKKARNTLLSQTPSNTLNRSSLLDSSSVLSRASSQRWTGVENMRLVGSHLVNMDNILRNAPQAQLQRKSEVGSQGSGKIDARVAEQKKKDEKLLNEIDLLLNQKSSHDHEANDEWHDNFQRRMKNLEKQEWKDQQKQQLQFIVISAFECLSCNGFITELYPSLCKDKNHTISSIKAVKRFFVCRNCGRRDSTLTNQQKVQGGIGGKGDKDKKESQQGRLFLPPNRNCTCGKDDWILPTAAVSVGGSSGGNTLSGERLVTSATDWTSRQDRLNMASRVSTLDKR